MPTNKFALARYRIIDSMLRKNDYVKTSDIARCCLGQIGFHVTQRTIQLDIEAMRYDPLLGYNAPIGYSSRQKAYFYENPEYSLYPFSFSHGDITLLENILELCPACDQLLCRVPLRGLADKIKFYTD